MINFKNCIAEDKVTKKQLNSLEAILDKVFAKIGMDVEFTRHFLDRVNDARNKTQITPKELALLFKKEYIKWGKPIAKMGDDAEGVMKDLESDINIPFVLNWNADKKELEMVAKTVMRKKNFTSPDRKFPVESVNEGVNDPAIFHAVFLAGGPGSGKSFMVGQTALTALGFRIINSDNAFEMAMKKAGMDTTPENIFSVKGQTIRKGAATLTVKKMEIALKGRLGLVIDGTGKDYAKIAKQAAKLRALGYEVAMIFVNTDKQTAIDRDAKRKRTLGPEVVTKMWADVQKNIGKFQNLFRNKMFVVDNSEGSNWQGATMTTYKQIKKWSEKEASNGIAKKWIAQERKPKPPTVRKEDVPGTSTTSVVGAGNNPTGTVVVDRRRRKDKHPKVLKKFRKYLENDG
jgi:shikimate kinase